MLGSPEFTTKYPIFILEGGDATGKSSLARAMGGHYLHCTYSKDLAGHMVKYVEHVMSAAVALSKHNHVVIDRWRMSEEVYAEAFRGGNSEGGQPETERLHRVAITLGVTFICCHPVNKAAYLSAFEKTKTERPEMYDSMNKVYDEYTTQIERLKQLTKVTVYDRFHLSPDIGQTYVEKAYAQKGLRY